MANVIIPRDKVSRRYYEYFSRFWRYEVIFGGRGSGKTKTVITKLLARAAVDEYFQCIYCRKEQVNIKHSQFDEFKKVAKMLGWFDEFKFNETDYTITCKRNGNKFIAKGLDKADKIKSTAEPTHVWVEEADQISWDDFDTLNKGLRSPLTQNSFILTFNTFVPESHWIRQQLFDKERIYELSDEYAPKAYYARTTFRDNDFLPDDYEETLTKGGFGNRYKIESDLNGTWGAEPNDNPWLYAFDVDKHVKEVPFYPSFPVWIFIDVNNDPFECTLWQMSPNKGAAGSFLHCIDEFSGKFKVEEMCHRINAKYPASIFYLGGDRSGQNEDVGRNQTIYQIMASILRLSPRQLVLNTHNLEHADSRLLCNAMFNQYPSVIIGKHCKNLIHQCEIARVDVKSATPFKLLKDRDQFKLDAFDSMRYMFQTCFNEFAKEVYFKALAQKPKPVIGYIESKRRGG